MKKIIKILFVFTFMIASKEILNAEEVKYKWFKYIDNNIHYEYNPEETCQNFEKIDYDNFIYGEYKYSLIKPEEKEGRVITKEVHNLDIDRHAINIMEIKKFDSAKNLYLTEFEIFDKDGNKVDYTIDHFYFEDGLGSMINDGDYTNNVGVGKFSVLYLKFDKPLNILEASYTLTYLDNMNTFNGLDIYFYIDRDLRVEVFDTYSELVTTNCYGGVCKSTVRPYEGRINYSGINVNSNIYKYKDRKYKCFTTKKEYLPGYFTDVQGYIKDEDDFIKLETTTKEELQNIINKSNNEISLLSSRVNKLVDENSKLRINFDNRLNNFLNNEELQNIINKSNNEISLLSSRVNSLINENYIVKTNFDNKLDDLLSRDKSNGNIIKVSTDKANDSKEVITNTSDTFIIIFSVLMTILIVLLLIKNIRRFHDK